MFSQEKCSLQDPLMKASLPLGKLVQGLYLQTTDVALKTNEVVVVTSKTMLDEAKLWHVRLGHVPFSKLKLLFPDMNTIAIKNNFLCTICPASRQTRLPFPTSHTTTDFAFDLLHVDV